MDDCLIVVALGVVANSAALLDSTGCYCRSLHSAFDNFEAVLVAVLEKREIVG